jgi:SSS family solute:Na+ symporter
VFTENDPVWGVNAGIVALGANLAVALVVTYAGPREHDDRPDGDVLARDEPEERQETAGSREPELSGVGIGEASDAPAGA